MLKRLVKTFSWSALGGALRVILGFAYAGLTVRWIGNLNAGVIWTLGGLHTVASALIGGGMIMAATREVSRKTDAAAPIINSVFAQFAILSLVVLLVSPAVLWASPSLLTGREAVAIMVFASVGFTVNRLYTVFISFLRAYQRYDLVTKINTLYDAGMLAMTAAAMQVRRDAVWFAAIFALVNVLLFVVVYFALARCMGGFPRPRLSLALLRPMWTFGRWVYVTNVFGSLNAGLDRTIVSGIFGPALLPFYSLPKKFYETFHTLLSQQTLNLLTLTAADDATDAEKAHKRKVLLVWFFGVVASWAYGVIVGIGPGVVALLTGAPADLRVWLAVAAFSTVGWFQAIMVPVYHLSYAEGRSALLCIVSIVTGGLAITMLTVLGRSIGFSATFFAEFGTIAVALLTIGRFLKGTAWPMRRVLTLLRTPLSIFAAHMATVFVLAERCSPTAVFIYTLAYAVLSPVLLLKIERQTAEGAGRVATLHTAISHTGLIDGRFRRLFHVYLGQT